MACLKAVPVTRLPSLRFLLSYSLAQKVRALGTLRTPALAFGEPPHPPQTLRWAETHSSPPPRQRAGSVLSHGVNPSSTFYVLNPHSNLLGTEERFRGWFER